jgi:murein DD-endopeptidase MepM/ murein hydrolase activator NlpD
MDRGRTAAVSPAPRSPLERGRAALGVGGRAARVLVALLAACSSAACSAAAPAPQPPAAPCPPAVAREEVRATPPDPPAVAVVRGLLGPARAATWGTFAPSFREAVPLARVESSAADSERTLGKLMELRQADESKDASRTRTTVLAFRERGTEVFTVTRDASGVVIGLRVADLVEREQSGPGPADAYVAKRTYLLPGKGAWYVANGGPTSAVNNHVGNTQQWYAFDLDKRDPQGKEARGDGKRNEDHLVFGELVLAPAEGTVVAVIDAVDDYPPGERERYVVPGNSVVIDYGGDEFSVLAHLQRGSIVVKVGQKVKAGQALGKVGNSGNTSDPHVHWHLANKAGLSRGSGLPIRFGPLLVNGKRVDDARPVRGDTIENAP